MKVKSFGWYLPRDKFSRNVNHYHPLPISDLKEIKERMKAAQFLEYAAGYTEAEGRAQKIKGSVHKLTQLLADLCMVADSVPMKACSLCQSSQAP